MNKKGQLGARQITINIAIIVISVLFLLLFAVSFLQNTNPESDFLTDDRINNSVQSLNNSANEFNDMSESTFNILRAVAEPSVSNAILIFKEAFSIPIQFLSFMFNGVNGIKEFLFIAFGGGIVGTVVFLGLGLLVSGILVTAVFLFIKFLRTGESER